MITCGASDDTEEMPVATNWSWCDDQPTGTVVAHGEEDSIGDVSTLADPSVVDALIAKFKEATAPKKK